MYRLAVFVSFSELMGFADEREFRIELKEPVIYDFDNLAKWMIEPKAKDIDCNSFLNAWNILGIYA